MSILFISIGVICLGGISYRFVSKAVSKQSIERFSFDKVD